MASIDDEVKTKFTGDKHRFITNLIFTSTWIKNSFNEFLKPFDLSSQQFNVLRILRGADDWVAMTEVKKLMIEKAPNATRLVDKLLNKELIIRERSESDRRIVYVKITELGLKLLQTIDESNNAFQKEFMERIDLDDAKYMNTILDKLRG